MAMDQIGLQYYIDLTKLNAGVAAVKSKIDGLNKSIMAVPKGATAPISGASAELKKMGVVSTTTTAQFEKMNFAVADHAKIAKLTRLQVKELENSMISSGKATSRQAHQFNRLGKRLEHSEYQVRKQTSAMGDARRAQERWGAGFKYMMLSQAAWIASGAVIFGTLGAITQALRDFLDFNQGLIDAAAITQATASGYKRMEIAAMNAFKSSTMGAKEATEALKILGQAGMDATDAAIALETVYKVTTATGGSTIEVVKFLTTAVNVWKLSAKEAADVGNILGAALNYSKLEVGDLGVTFNYVASIAKSTGMSITDLAATMAVMANAGIKASTIGTGLRGVMSKLLSGSGKLDGELAKVGLRFEDVTLTSHNLMESLETLSEAGFDLTNVFTGLRRREAAALNVMLEQGVERFNLMAAALKDTTAIEVMFERSMKGMKNQLILTGHQIQAVLIDALKVSQPIIIGVAKAIQSLVSALRDLSPILIGVGTTLAIWKISAIIAAAATTKLAAGFTVATVSAGLLGKALILLTKHPVLVGLTLLIGAFTAGKAIVDKFTTSTKELVGELNTQIDDLRKLQILMSDSARADEEKLRILADYAKEYPVLLELLGKEKVALEDILKLISKEIKVRGEGKVAAKEQELALKELQLARAEEYNILKKQHWLMKFALVTGPDESDLKKRREEISLLRIKLGIMKGEKAAPEIITKKPPFMWLPDMQKALDKLRYEQSLAKEQAHLDLVEGLAEFGMTEEKKTGLTAEQIEARKLLYIDYKKKLSEINKKDIEEMFKYDEKIIAAITKIKDEHYNKEFEYRKISKKNALDDADFKKWLADEELKREEKKWAKTIKGYKKLYNELKLMTDFMSPEAAVELSKLLEIIKQLEKLKPVRKKPKVDYDKRDMGAGMLEGLKKYRGLIEDEYKIWEEMAYESAMAMQNSFSDLFFDAMMGDLHSLSDYWKSFTTSIKRMIANMASMWLMFSVFGGYLPGKTHEGGLIKAHSGGLIKKMHSGGQNLKSDETIRILKDREYVIKDSSTRSIGVAALDFANKTGRLPQAAPQQVIHKHYTYVYAIDSESMDLALRKRGAGAIGDISLNANAYARGRQDPRVSGRGRY